MVVDQLRNTDFNTKNIYIKKNKRKEKQISTNKWGKRRKRKRKYNTRKKGDN